MRAIPCTRRGGRRTSERARPAATQDARSRPDRPIVGLGPKAGVRHSRHREVGSCGSRPYQILMCLAHTPLASADVLKNEKAARYAHLHQLLARRLRLC